MLTARCVLLCRVGDFDLRVWADVIPLGLGILILRTLTAGRFGRFNGGNNPTA